MRFSQKCFQSGSEKIDFIEKRLAAQMPVLVSLARLDKSGLPTGWHIMAVMDADADRLCFLNYVHLDGRKEKEWLSKSEVAELHDKFPGGKEIAYLDIPPNGR